MWEVIRNFFTNGDIWGVIIKVLITALLTTGIGLIGTLIGKIIIKNKNSKIYKYAKTCVKAAEQKFPNEGKKMGPEKMAYVMDQLAIKFPKIRENTYLYNIAEAAVYELNKEDQQEEAIKEFEQKYGEKPLMALEKETNLTVSEESEVVVTNDDEENKEIKSSQEVNSTSKTVKQKKNRMVSF